MTNLRENRGQTLGQRMKEEYEDRYRFYLPRRVPIIVRLDGQAFHTYTRGLERPWDIPFMADMDQAVMSLVKHVQNCRLAYWQSDEVSLLLVENPQLETSAWFDGNLQKIVSISASRMTAEFNKLRWARNSQGAVRCAVFDARAWIISDPQEVVRYFMWRQADCASNSIQQLAQSTLGHKNIQGIGNRQLINLMQEQGVDWSELDPYFRHGRCAVSENEYPFDSSLVLDKSVPWFGTRRDYILRAFPQEPKEINT